MNLATARFGPDRTGFRCSRDLPGWSAVILGAFILMLPAIFNGRPFIFWDTASYLAVGKLILAADPTAAIVALENNPALIAAPPTQAERQALLDVAASHLGARGVTYSLFLERGLELLSFRGVAFLQCLAVAATLYLALSWIWTTGLRAWTFLLICAGVALFTSGGIVANLLLPDIFAAALLLLIALLFTGWSGLSKTAALAVFFGLWLVLAMHPSHAPIAMVMTVAGLLLVWLRSASLRSALRPAALAIVAIVAAAVLSAGLKAVADRAVGTPLERPPFLIARVIDDGPGRRYLESSCDPAQFEICKYKDRVLSQKYFAGDSVLFRREIEGGGVYMIEPIEVRERLRAQELAFAREAVLTYPLDQLRASAKNAARLLVQAKLDEIGSQLTYSYQNYAAAIGWSGTDAMLDSLPGIATCKQNPRARCGNLNIRIVRLVDYASFLLGAAVLAWVAAGFIARHRLSVSKLDTVDAFVLMILVGVVVNALVMGALAGPFDRYQTRVSWLLPAIALAVAVLSPDKLLSPRALLARLRTARASA